MSQVPLALEFVTITSPNQIKDPTKQKAIRRQARRRGNDVKSRSRKPVKITFDVPSDHVEEDLVPLIKGQYGIASYYTTLTQDQNFDLSLLSSSANLLKPLSPSDGSVFGLTSSPDMDLRAVQLMNYIRHGGDGNFCPLMDFWFSIGQLDSTAFCVTLANASRLINKAHPYDPKESREAIFIYTRSIECLRRRLKIPVDGLSEGVIVSILEFAYYDFLIQDLKRWLIHMSGLANIICRRGGLQTLYSSEMILLLTFWIDVSGSFIFDSSPFFPPPHHLTTQLVNQTPSSRILQKWNESFPELSDITTFLYHAGNLTAYIDGRAIGHEIWKDDVFVAKTFNIIVHQLLSLERHSEEMEKSTISPQLLMREAIRRACLILFALLRERFSVIPSGISQHKSRVKEFLIQHPIDWSNFPELHLWVLLIAGLAAEDDEIPWYGAGLNATMSQMRISAWESGIEEARSILWMEALQSRGGRLKGLFELSVVRE